MNRPHPASPPSADPAGTPGTSGTPEAARPTRPRGRRLARALSFRLAIVGIVVGYFSVSGCMEKLFYQPTAGPTPPPSYLSGAERITFTSSDGTRLTGWFIPAQERRVGPPDDADTIDATPPARGPAILHVHGNAGNMEDHLWFVEYLPEAGFHVLLFDYRGYGESEGRASRRAGLIADTHAALDALLARPEVDPARVGLYGQSLGGAIGMNVAAARPEIHAAVLESPFASWRLAAATALGGAPPGFLARSLAWLLIPDHHRVDEAIHRFARPALLLHGTDDRVVPIMHSRLLVEAGGEHATLIELDGGEHNTLRDSHDEIEAMVIGFLRQHLGSEPGIP